VALALFPEIPTFHHFSNCAMTTCLLCHPKIEQGWGCSGSIPDCIPVKMVELSWGEIFFMGTVLTEVFVCRK
jgi:hypothetical protein